MGHRLSKSPGNRASETATTTTRTTTVPEQQQLGGNLATSNRPNSLPPAVTRAINLQIQEEPRQDLEQSSTSSLSSSYSLMNASNTSAASSNSHRQIIIKIQLAKMVNDNETAAQQQQQQQEAVAGEEYGYVGWESSSSANEAAGSFTSATNNNNNGNQQEQSSPAATRTTTATTTTTYPLISQLSLEREARRLNPAHLEADEESRVLLRHPGYSAMLEAPEYIDVLEEGEAANTTTTTTTTTTTPTNGNVVATSSPSGGAPVCCRCQKSKRRCCKCTCLVAFRRMLEPSSSSSSSSSATSSSKKANKLLPQERKHSTKAVQLRVAATQRASVPAATNQVAIWSSDRASMGPSGATSNSNPPPFNPQILVVQCPPRTSVVTVESTDDTIHVLATTHACDSNANNTSAIATAATPAAPATSLVASTGASTTVANRGPQGPIVHSQVDFVHYLVPDLEKITNASYYWGKMDRYEAERLLEGKPEGTFLLRDSAQEEFLFSVTFRKYGRSLHARIEQSGHKFSFDCHDPHVFNALTVTGLLEHYKDPACVMFFEPMLTIPLHRHRPFSLQQLCRATIVSHTSYDGISEMELPARLKGYLKEYHYKQKLRVKPFDEPFYTTRT